MLLLLAGCTDRPDEPAPTSPTSVSSQFDAFDEATVVIDSGGGERRLDVWLAATDQQRQRGLMEVTDASLEGRLGMAFWFDAPTDSGFWMRNTRLPLTIVFVDDDGAVVSIAEMVPCPDTEVSCPVTRPDGPYRWALEVPTARWAEAGITPGATLILEADEVNATGSS